MAIKRLNDLKTKILAFTDSEYAEKKRQNQISLYKKKSLTEIMNAPKMIDKCGDNSSNSRTFSNYFYYLFFYFTCTDYII